LRHHIEHRIHDGAGYQPELIQGETLISFVLSQAAEDVLVGLLLGRAIVFESLAFHEAEGFGLGILLLREILVESGEMVDVLADI
jgi:hypothetical protein